MANQETTSRKKVSFISLGCPKNTVDTEVMLQACIDDDYEISTEVEGSDVVVINTCGFIESAKQESIDAIIEMTEAKREGLTKKVIVTGCLSQRYGTELHAEIPEIDAFLGSEHQTRLPGMVKSLFDGTSTAEADRKPLYIEEPGKAPVQHHRRFQTTPKHWAYLKISEGCDQTCTFCAIPMMRGKFRSKPIDAIVEEATSLAANGCKELVLVSQETASYGKDLARETTIREMLQALEKVDGIEWLRLMYLFPKNITEALIAEIADNSKVVPYVDMPFQHCSDRMLKRMGRQQTNAYLRSLVTAFRERIPSAALRTTLMVGFPGETDEDFRQLLDFVEESAFEHLGVFTYSHEDDTPAARFEDDVPAEVKEERRDALMELQASIAEEKLLDLEGQVVDVLVDGISDESELLLQGRMATQAPEIDGVVYITDGFARIGELVQVRIDETHVYDVAGAIIRS